VRFKVDENLPVELTEELRAAGHEAATVDNQRLVGASDRHLSEVCKTEGRVFVTWISISPTYEPTHRTSIPDLSCCVSPGKTSLTFSTCSGER